MSNKETVIAALKALGVNHVMVDYDGYEDSGQINHVVAYNTSVAAHETNTVAAYKASLDNEVVLDDDEVVLNDELNNKIRDLCWDYLESTFPGWEINGGASGNFTLDVESGKIHLTHSAYFTDSETTEQEF